MDGPNDTQLLGRMVTWGVPYRASMLPVTEAHLFEDFVAATQYAHRNATFARALPIGLWKRRLQLLTHAEAAQSLDAQSRRDLGFFFELTAALGAPFVPADADAVRRFAVCYCTDDTAPLRAAREHFFTDRTRHRDFAVAQRWGYLMNMSLDDFSTLFGKFAHAPSR